MKAGVVHLMMLDHQYQWWWLRPFRPSEKAPVDGAADYVDESGTRWVLLPVHATRWGRLMASEGLTGSCKPGTYHLHVANGVAPRLVDVAAA